MFKKINPKPLTIKEYKQNYKFPEKEKISLDDEYIHRTQKNFLSNIIQNKLKMKNNVIKIEKDEDVNKTLEKIFRKAESRIRILNILKRRNHNISLISEGFTISKSNRKDISHDSLINKYKWKKSFDFNTPNKKKDKLNLPIKTQSNKPLIPLLLNKNRKKEKINNNNDNDITINKNNKTTNKKIITKKDDDIHTSGFYLETEPNKGKYNIKFNKNNKIQKTDKNNNTNTNEKNKEKSNKSFRNSYKPNKKKINLKIEKNCQINLTKKIKNIQNKYIPEKRAEIQILKQIQHIHNNYIQEKGEEIQILKQIQHIHNNYMQVKGEEIQILKKIKNIHNKYIQERGEEIQILTKKGDNDKELNNYTGYILIKQNKGKNIEKINLDKNENNIKELLLNVINEMTEEQNEIISKNELLVLNGIKQDNSIKEQKIKEQELLIQEEKKLYLNLKNEFDKLILENNNLKEKITSFEIKENELKELNISFIEYKKQKSEEIQNLNLLIKQYENELNKIKQEKNDIKKYNIEKQNELFIEKLINKTIDTSIYNNNNESINKEKDVKIYKILDKIKKKKSSEINNNEQNIIKKTDKINQLRKMLVQQIKSESKDNEKCKEKIIEEKIENKNNKIDFVNLFVGIPIIKSKRKPKNKINFIE